MTREEIVTKVNRALSDQFELPLADFTPEADIQNDLGLDSLDFIDMIIVIEQEFDFKLPDRNAIQQIRTLHDIYDFIESLGRDGHIA